MLHGVELYRIHGEGTLGGALTAPSARGDVIHEFVAAAADPLMSPEKRRLAPRHTFCRLFPKGAQLDATALSTLGFAMEAEGEDARTDSSIAAGYTYFGQFVDHDITFDRKTALTAGGSIDPEQMENHRTPALDLDSVYGGGPEVSPELYESDGFTLRVGACTKSKDQAGNEIGELPNDLPRQDRIATIADPRNDENLALAQLHLAFLKFHNKLAKELRSQTPSLSASNLFRRAQRSTVLHYQRIILRDFLPRIIDTNAIEAVLSGGHRVFKPELQKFMPVEFSVAAYRLGHSMIRSVYEWNRVFNSKAGAIAKATLELLFEFTQFSGSTSVGDRPFFGTGDSLPSNWPVDWRMMFDIPGAPPAPGFAVNRARKLDTSLANALKTLPEFAGVGEADPALLSLASRNLLRGRLVQLSSGLEAAQAIKASGLDIHVLSTDELAAGKHGSLLKRLGLADAPPLWYYILREAELHGGERLGDVGSCIVAETIVAHIRNAEISILADAGINSLADIPRFSMADLLLKVDDLSPV